MQSPRSGKDFYSVPTTPDSLDDEIDPTDQSLQNHEKKASHNFDFERALSIQTTRKNQEIKTIESQTQYYNEFIDQFNKENSLILEKQKQKINEIYESDIESIKKEYHERLEMLEDEQDLQIQELKKMWVDACQEESRRIDLSVGKMLEVSQIMADAGKYQKAIKVRDVAVSTNGSIKNQTHTSLQKIDQKYSGMFATMNNRHKKEIDKLLTEFNYDMKVRTDEKIRSETAAMNAFKINELASTEKVVQNVVSSNFNPEITKKIIEPFSPKRPKSHYTSSVSSSSRLSEVRPKSRIENL